MLCELSMSSSPSLNPSFLTAIDINVNEVPFCEHVDLLKIVSQRRSARKIDYTQKNSSLCMKCKKQIQNRMLYSCVWAENFHISILLKNSSKVRNSRSIQNIHLQYSYFLKIGVPTQNMQIEMWLSGSFPLKWPETKKKVFG